MALDKRHFPTVHKIGSLFPPGAAKWIVRNTLRERFLIRLGLFICLFVSLVSIASSRYLNLGGGNLATYRMGYQPNGFWIERDIVGTVHNVTVFILGTPVAQLAPMLVVLCLIGLAVTSRPPGSLQPNEPQFQAIVTADHLGPLPEEWVSKPADPPKPQRHPLDPDPDDLPLEPLWPRTSPLSR